LELVTKTYPITFQVSNNLVEGELVFTVEYKAYQTDAEPAYLTYIKGQLEGFVASTVSVNVNAVNLLLTKGNSFKITIEYAGTSYEGMNWDTTLQSFKIHNDWISTASGAEGLTNATIRDAFNSVVIDPAEPEKTQHSPNTPMFADKTATITTADTFTDTQWNAIVTAIAGKFSEEYDVEPDESIKKSSYEDAFIAHKTIVVEKNPTGYINYKYNKSERTLYVYANGVNNLNTDTIILAMLGGGDNIDGVTQY
jgi:hypothetical protein